MNRRELLKSIAILPFINSIDIFANIPECSVSNDSDGLESWSESRIRECYISGYPFVLRQDLEKAIEVFVKDNLRKNSPFTGVVEDLYPMKNEEPVYLTYPVNQNSILTIPEFDEVASYPTLKRKQVMASGLKEILLCKLDSACKHILKYEKMTYTDICKVAGKSSIKSGFRYWRQDITSLSADDQIKDRFGHVIYYDHGLIITDFS